MTARVYSLAARRAERREVAAASSDLLRELAHDQAREALDQLAGFLRSFGSPSGASDEAYLSLYDAACTESDGLAETIETVEALAALERDDAARAHWSEAQQQRSELFLELCARAIHRLAAHLWRVEKGSK